MSDYVEVKFKYPLVVKQLIHQSFITNFYHYNYKLCNIIHNTLINALIENFAYHYYFETDDFDLRPLNKRSIFYRLNLINKSMINYYFNKDDLDDLSEYIYYFHLSWCVKLDEEYIKFSDKIYKKYIPLCYFNLEHSASWSSFI